MRAAAASAAAVSGCVRALGLRCHCHHYDVLPVRLTCSELSKVKAENLCES